MTGGLIIEEIAYGDFNVGYVQLLGSLNGQIIARHGAANWPPNGCRASLRGESLSRSP